MYNSLYLKDKLETFGEVNDFVIGIDSLIEDGVIIKVKSENFHLIEEFLMKYDIYEYEVVTEFGNVTTVEIRLKERFKKQKIYKE